MLSLERDTQKSSREFFDAIDAIALESVKPLEMGDVKTIPELFFLNQCMLKAIGVSNRKIDELVDRLAELGLSAKITGAGGGGCVIGIGDNESIEKAMKDFDGFLVEAGAEGVRFEEEDV